jgi:putative methyltransferase
VAFINPPHADWSLANNAAYLMFQSHYNRFGKYADFVDWKPAPYKFNKYNNVEEIYEEVKGSDIYLFSSYVWNYDICDELAKYIKLVEPNSFCILGGPQIGTNDKDFISQRIYYDFISRSTKPGEVFVADLIDSYIDNNGVPKFQDIAWELRSDKSCDQFMPDYSVYEEHLSYLKETREYARENIMEPFCIIETTRGCPYQCTFCEWGGGIGTKIYKKPLEIVKKDLLALKSAGYRDVYLTDANFGAFFDRDIEIFKFAWTNGINLTDISTMKSRDLKRRTALIDAWFEIVGTGFEKHSPVEGITDNLLNPKLAGAMDQPHFISVVPTVSLQSVSDEAMKVAKRVDLSFKDKIKLSEHIRKRCQEEGYPVPAIELILGMPGSTIDDFYEELNILWNFQSWGNYRHDYMFLPDADLSDPDYIKQYDIELVEVYSDLIDESGVDNDNSLYKNKRQYFKTLASCYSYTREEFYEMWFMNIAGNYLLKHLYPSFTTFCSASTFGKVCYQVIQDIEGFDEIMDEIQDILDPATPPRNCKRLLGRLRFHTVNDFIASNIKLLYNELFVRIAQLVDSPKENKKVIPILET